MSLASVCVFFNGPYVCVSQSSKNAQVSSISVTAGEALAYLADQQGFVHVYNIREYGLQGPESQPPLQ
jgi:hypothetical protein